MPKTLGQVSYESYCEARSWRSFNGNPLPEWKDVRNYIQSAWEAAGWSAVEAHLLEPREKPDSNKGDHVCQ